MTTLLIPMAGRGSRFASRGYDIPKPLLPIGPWKMYQVVLSNLFHASMTRIVLVTVPGMVSKNEVMRLGTVTGCEIKLIELSARTDGAARTVQLGLEELPDDALIDPLVVANSDQYISAGLSEFFSAVSDRTNAILTMEDNSPKWSYVRVDDLDQIVTVAEKQVISDQATVGVYGFGSARSFLEGLDQMVSAGDRTNGELYVAPVYNYLPSWQRGYIFRLGPVGEIMHGLGIPDDYEAFLTGESAQMAVQKTNEFFGLAP